MPGHMTFTRGEDATGQGSHMSRHRHAVASSRTIPFAGPVKRDENRAAHGNTTIVDACACGAERRTNCNGVHEERGSWRGGNTSSATEFEKVTFHRNGTVTVWNVYAQRWTRTCRPSDELLSSIDSKIRARVERHCANGRDLLERSE